MQTETLIHKHHLFMFSIIHLFCFSSPSVRALHIAVAQGKRALAYVLATKMAQCGSVDVKEHNGQVQILNKLLHLNY